MVHQLIYWSFLAFVLGLAHLRGGPPERYAIAAWTIASMASTAAVVLHWGAYETLQVGVFAIDLALLGFLVWLALNADRRWPLWVTGFHLVGVLTHIAKALKPDLNPWAYAVGQAGGSYLILIAIAIGAERHRKRTRQNGPERSWRTFSVRSAVMTPPDYPTA